MADAEEEAAVVLDVGIEDDEPLATVAVFLHPLEEIRVVPELDEKAWAAPGGAAAVVVLEDGPAVAFG